MSHRNWQEKQLPQFVEIAPSLIWVLLSLEPNSNRMYFSGNCVILNNKSYESWLPLRPFSSRHAAWFLQFKYSRELQCTAYTFDICKISFHIVLFAVRLSCSIWMRWWSAPKKKCFTNTFQGIGAVWWMVLAAKEERQRQKTIRKWHADDGERNGWWSGL